jgi:hypothetical protein
LTPCRSETLEENSLRQRIGDSNAQLRRYTLIQERLSNIVLDANETGGNLLLGILVLILLWLTVMVVDGLRRVYLISDGKLRAELDQRLAPNTVNRTPQLSELIKADYARKYKNLAFMRVFGPATGFLLTVSSLIAGLHPSAAAAQDTFRFVSSLQLALVATFMGLAVRILAELAVRFHREDAERQLDHA